MRNTTFIQIFQWTVSPLCPAANPQVAPATVPSHLQSLDTTSPVCAARKELHLLVPKNV